MAIRTMKVSTYVKKILQQAMESNDGTEQDGIRTWQDANSTITINPSRFHAFYVGTYGKWQCYWKWKLTITPEGVGYYARKITSNPKPVDETAQNYAGDMIATH